MSHNILVIEDEATLAKNIKLYLERYGYDVRLSQSAHEGIGLVDTYKPDLVLLDLQLPDRSGLELIPLIRRKDEETKIIMMTAYGNVQIAVDAMKAGAYDYLSKPLILSELKILLDKAVGQTRMEGTLSYYREKDAVHSGLEALLGESPPMKTLREEIRQLIQSESVLAEGIPPSVLITGETGTGKGLVARAIHYSGPRQGEPFVEINCASIPNNLLEAELFGYERGAFTDAKERKRGLFEAAHGGTLFLDEVGDMDISLQVKLLKCLENNVIRRLGSIRDRKVNARIIAATNQPLEELSREGKFRSDLYFRLRVITVKMPELRQCGKDILLLANHCLEKLCRRYRKKEMHLSPEAEETLLNYEWPGNVRELRNTIERTVFMSNQETIEPFQLGLRPGLSKRAFPRETKNVENAYFVLPSKGISLEDVERNVVVQALEQSGWNVTRAAKLVGLSRDTLRYRMEKYKLEPHPKG
ncbi:MAG: sigma-54-dependent transcriptional regulator [Nitrospiria bacterium]